MNAFIRNPVFPRHFDSHFNFIPDPASPPAAAEASAPDPTGIFNAKIKAQKALQLLLRDDMIDRRLREILDRIIESGLDHDSASGMTASEEMKAVREIRTAILELMRSFKDPGEKKYAELCRHMLASIEMDIDMLGADARHRSIQPSDACGTQHVPDAADLGHHHHHHHDQTRLKRLLKRLLGTSDIDEGPHGVIGAKAGIMSVTGRDDRHEGAPDANGGSDARLENILHHEIPASAAACAGDGVLAGVLLGAGGLGFGAGRGEKKEGKEEKRNDALLQRTLKRKREDFLARISASGDEPNAAETPLQRKERLHNNRLLHRELRVIDEELRQVNERLDNVKYKIGLGRGSEAAGASMMAKGLIDIVTKPLSFVSETAAPIAAGVTGFASLGLSPAAAAAGLYMGANSKKHAKAELTAHRGNLAAAAQSYALIKHQLPPDIQSDYDRFFAQGKWATREQGLRAFNNLMTWFVSGMSGYTAGITGITAAKIAALIVGAAAIADITASTAVLISVAAVLYGTFGFMKYHARQHQHEEWARTDDPECDKDFMKTLAADGGAASIELPVALMGLLDEREANRIDFLIALGGRSGLRYKGIKMHSTDTDEIRNRRRDQRDQMENGGRRFIAKSKRASKDMMAGARMTGAFLQKAASAAASAGHWKDAHRSAKAGTPDADGSARGSGHHLRLKATARTALHPAVEGAREAYADSTPYMNPRNLARLFNDAENHADLAAFMLRDVEGILSWTDKKLTEKIRTYDMPEGEIEDEMPSRYEAEPESRDREKAAKRSRRFWFSAYPEKKEKGKARAAAEEDDTVAAHWREIGRRLAFDKQSFDQAMELRSLLRAWSEPQAGERPTVGPAQDMREAISRYLALMHEKLYERGGSSEREKPAEQRLSEFLLKPAEQRYRKKRARLISVFLATAPLRLDAARRAAEAVECKKLNAHFWEAARDAESGVPKIVAKQAEDSPAHGSLGAD